MNFYLGVHIAAYLARAGVRLFVSHNILRRQKTWLPAIAPWALDSGGFTELSRFGFWRYGPDEYLDAADRYRTEIGQLEWIAPQDWMCEPIILAKTGLTIPDHQERTVENFLELRAKQGDLHVIPVLQGWTLIDYMRCLRLYREAGVDLRQEQLVGVGTVCRRQDTQEGSRIFRALSAAGLRTHGFGIKVTGLKAYGHHLASADSMAWSYAARKRKLRLSGCTHDRCNNCLKWALKWRAEEVGIRD